MTRRHETKGFAMLAVLGYVLVITILSTAFFSSVHRSVKVQHQHIQAKKSFVLAESGVHHAIIALEKDAAFGGASGVVFPDGNFTTLVTTGTEPNSWVIESTGGFGEDDLHTTTLRATVSRSAGSWSVRSWVLVPKYEVLGGAS